jgi:hypothetical protein
MNLTPAQCREHADHCRELKARSPLPWANDFEKLAEVWLRLADDLERLRKAGRLGRE